MLLRVNLALPILLLGTGCGSEAPLTPSGCLAERSCGVPLVCAHRGLCADAPENTLAGFLACERAGVPMLEVDTRDTSDGSVVIMHDDTVERTTDGEDRFAGRTGVDQLTLQEIRSLVIDDEGCLADPDRNPDLCRVPSLADLLERTGDQTLLFIDFKEGDPLALAGVVLDAGASHRVIVFDGNLEVLRAYRSVVEDGLVMPRADDSTGVELLLTGSDGDLDLRWIHIEPDFLDSARVLAEPAGVRLYLDGFGPVDTYFSGAEMAADAEAKAEFERQAREGLEHLIGGGARGLGTNFAERYVEVLYPDGFGT
jgi:glycerophosphoryl diester phosphodiesterase